MTGNPKKVILVGDSGELDLTKKLSAEVAKQGIEVAHTPYTEAYNELKASGLIKQANAMAAAQQPRVVQLVRNMPKVGRNAPCPCGSGLKFKKCCWAKCHE